MAIKAMSHLNPPTHKIDLLYFPFKERDVFQKLSNGVDDVGQIQIAGCDFVQHGSEQEEVFLVDQRDLNLGTSRKSLIEFERRIQAGETPTNDHDSVFLIHLGPLSVDG